MSDDWKRKFVHEFGLERVRRAVNADGTIFDECYFEQQLSKFFGDLGPSVDGYPRWLFLLVTKIETWINSDKFQLVNFCIANRISPIVCAGYSYNLYKLKDDAAYNQMLYLVKQCYPYVGNDWRLVSQ